MQKHVFTHFVSLQAIEKSIDVLKKTASIIEQYYKGSVPSEVIEELGEKYHFNEVPKTSFLKTVVDGFYVERFDIDRATEEITEDEDFNEGALCAAHDDRPGGASRRWIHRA